MTRPNIDDSALLILSQVIDAIAHSQQLAAFGDLVQPRPRQAHRRRGVGGHVDHQPQPVFDDLPERRDRTVHRVIAGLYETQITARLWLDGKVLIAGVRSVDLDPGHDLVEPASHGAIRVVVQRSKDDRG